MTARGRSAHMATMTNYSENPGIVRLDVFEPSGKWHKTVALDMSEHYESGPCPADAVSAAIRDQGRYEIGQWTFSVADPYFQPDLPVVILADGADTFMENRAAPTVPCGADPQPEVNDLLASISLYLGRYEWSQLTTEQKELFADRIDASRAISDEPDEFSAVDRWWRQDTPARRAEPNNQDLDLLLVRFAGQSMARRRFAARHRLDRSTGMNFSEWDAQDPSCTQTDLLTVQAQEMFEAGLLSWPRETSANEVIWMVERLDGRILGFGFDTASALDYCRNMHRKKIQVLLSWTFAAR